MKPSEDKELEKQITDEIMNHGATRASYWVAEQITAKLEKLGYVRPTGELPEMTPTEIVNIYGKHGLWDGEPFEGYAAAAIPELLKAYQQKIKDWLEVK